MAFSKGHIVSTSEFVQGSSSVVSQGVGPRDTMLVAERNDLFLRKVEE